MRILFATTRGYLPQCVGGSEWSTHFLCLGLKAAGDTVGLVCHLQNKGWLALENRLKSKVTGQRYPADRRMGYPVFRGWGAINGINEAVRAIDAEAVVIIGAPPNASGLALEATKAGLPVFYQIRDIEFTKQGEGLDNLPGVRYISNSDFTAERFFQRFGIRSDVVLPPVQSSHCRVSQPGRKVLMINPAPSKGGEIALAMAEQRPKVPFVFQESWADNSRLVDLKQRAKVAGNIEWRSPTMDIRTAYAEARILLAPSQSEEAWGRIATEAHFSGIPVIASDRGGLPQAVGPGGLLLPHDAPLTDWLAALDRLWSSESEWSLFSKRALEYSMRSEIAPEHQISKFRDILLDGLGQR